MLAVVDLLGPVAQTAGQVFFGLALVDPGGVLLLGAKQGVPFSQPEGVLCVLDAALGVGLIVLLGPAALEFIIQIGLGGLFQLGAQFPELFQLARPKNGLQVPLVIRQGLELGVVGQLDAPIELPAVLGISGGRPLEVPILPGAVEGPGTPVQRQGDLVRGRGVGAEIIGDAAVAAPTSLDPSAFFPKLSCCLAASGIRRVP